VFCHVGAGDSDGWWYAYRDVKPANVLIEDEARGYARLGDVGIARHMGVGATHVLTSAQGTPRYEQCRHVTPSGRMITSVCVRAYTMSVRLEPMTLVCLPSNFRRYIDPVFVESGRLSTASDVYSVGIVLLQLLTARNDPSGLAGSARIRYCSTLPYEL
jgi:serine/threonine protein kinase